MKGGKAVDGEGDAWRMRGGVAVRMGQGITLDAGMQAAGEGGLVVVVEGGRGAGGELGPCYFLAGRDGARCCRWFVKPVIVMLEAHNQCCCTPPCCRPPMLRLCRRCGPRLPYHRRRWVWDKCGQKCGGLHGMGREYGKVWTPKLVRT